MITVLQIVADKKNELPCTQAFLESVGEDLMEEPHRVLGVLRAYYSYSVPNASLSAVFFYTQNLLRETVHGLPPVIRRADTEAAFAAGRLVTLRQMLLELYGTCYLALAEHVEAWNKRQKEAS